MNFFYYESKFKIKKQKNIFFGWRGLGVRSGGGARVSDFFFHKESKSKIFFFFGGGGGGRDEGARGGVDGWTDEQAQTNLPLQLLRSWGHNNALMYKLCKLCP